MAKTRASSLARILIAACACVFRVDPMALQIVTSPVLVRALVWTIAGQIVGAIDQVRTPPTFAGAAVVRKQKARRHF
jgi:hypothetical protein